MSSKSTHKNRLSRSNRGWKDVQYNRKSKKRTKLAVCILAFVVGLLVISWAVRFTQSLFTPLKVNVSQRRNYIWNGEFNINLLVRTNHISLLVFIPKQKTVTIVDIPDEILVDVPHGFGKWQLRAVYELGQTQNGIGGDNLLKETLESLFALPIDGFLDFSTLQRQKTASELVDILRKNPFSGIELIPTLKTDLTIWELLKLKMGIDSVRFDKVAELNLSQLSILNQEDLPDGTKVQTANPVKLDSILSILTDPVIAQENKTIAVFNATDRPQLAEKWSRLISNLGGNVIITSNAREQLKNTRVIGDKSLTLKRLKQVFNNLDCSNSPKCDKISSVDEQISSRAQINVLLGEDLLDK